MNNSKGTSFEGREQNDGNRKNKQWQTQKHYSVDQYSTEFLNDTDRLQGRGRKYRAMARADRRKYDLHKLNHQ